jgi:hypothetical protein
LFTLVPAQARGESHHDPFVAICQSDETHTFRDDSPVKDAFGEERKEWSTDDRFPGNWLFEFDGKELIIDQKKVVLLPSAKDILIALSYGKNNISGSLWTYVINIPLGKIGAAQVNGYTGILSEGIKTRTTNFECSFVYP